MYPIPIQNNMHCWMDWINFIVYTCDMKNKELYYYFLLKETVKLVVVTLIVNFIPSKFWSLTQGLLKVILHTDLNGYRESSGGSPFVINSLLVCYKWSQITSISCTNLISLLTSIKVCPIPIQNNMHCWWIEIKENPKYKL